MPEQATILVVDDLPQNVRLARVDPRPTRLPRGRGEPGPEAREHVAAEPVDLVLLDILMPEMHGYAVCRALRAEPPTSYLPV
jgi:CheY-like chemotaxis protein